MAHQISRSRGGLTFAHGVVRNEHGLRVTVKVPASFIPSHVTARYSFHDFRTCNYHMIGMYFTIKHSIRALKQVLSTILAG